MGMENGPRSSSEINWGDTGERLIGKVAKQREELVRVYGEDRGAEQIAVLNNLENRIHDMFPAFENRQTSVATVEDEVQHQIDGAENEEEKIIYKQILAMVRSSGGPLF